MKNSTPQELMISIFLSMDFGYCIEHIGKVNIDWFDISLHKRVMNCITDLISKRTDPNILTVINKLKSEGSLEKGDVVKITKMTSSLPEWKVNFDSVAEAVLETYHRNIVRIAVNNISRNLSDYAFNINTALIEAEKMKQAITKNETVDLSNAQIIEDVMASHKKAKEGTIDGLELGFDNLRGKILLEPVDMMVVGARPAMGKTAFAISVMIKLAFENNKKVALFSLEMSKVQIMRRMVSLITGIDSNTIKYGKCSAQQVKKIHSLQMMEEWDNITIYEGAHTAGDIQRKVTSLKHLKGVDLFIVDYLQKLKGDKRMSKYELVSSSSNAIKETSQNLLVPSIALAQLRRDTKNAGKRPSLHDLKESGEIEQDASIVAFLHRPEYYGEDTFNDGSSSNGMGEFLIAKNREGSLGIHKFDVNLSTSKWSQSMASFSDKKQNEELPF